MSDNTTSSNTVSNHQPQGVQTVSTTRTDATQVMKTKIPQAISSLGGVAKSNDIKAWILNDENATKDDFGLCKSAGVLKKYPNGRYNFDIAYVSQTVSMKKKGILFTPAWSWLSLTPDADLPNGVVGKKPKNRAELPPSAISQEVEPETISQEVEPATISSDDSVQTEQEIEMEDFEINGETFSVPVNSDEYYEDFGNAEAEDIDREYAEQIDNEIEKIAEENLRLSEENLQLEADLVPVFEERELEEQIHKIEEEAISSDPVVDINDGILEVSVDSPVIIEAHIDIESQTLVENAGGSKDIETPLSEVEEGYILSNTQGAINPEVDTEDEDVWDDIFDDDDEPVAQILGLNQLPDSSYFGKVEVREDGTKGIILSDTPIGNNAYSINLELDPSSIEVPRAQKMYRKLQVGELGVADKLLGFFSSHNPQSSLEAHLIEIGVPYSTL